MLATFLICSLFIFLALRVPIYASLGLSAAGAVVFFTDLPLSIVFQRSVTGIDSLTLLAAPLFVLAGSLVLEGGISERLIRLVDDLFGFSKFRLAFSNVWASLFFGGISGSAVADSAAIGSVMIPEMKNEGYPASFAAGLTATSSSLGIIVPPSIPMIIAGSVATGASVGQLFIGGYIPALLIAISLCLVVMVRSRSLGVTAARVPFAAGEILKNIGRSFWALLFPVVVMGGILAGVFTATEAGAVAVAYSLVVAGLIYRTLTVRAIVRILKETAEFTTVIFVIVASAQAFGWVLTITGIPQSLSRWLLGTLESPVAVTFAILGILLLLGCFMETVAIILVVYPLLEPVATAIGMHPVQYGVLFIVTTAIGLFTPPYGMLLFVNARIANLSSKGIALAVVPFMGAMLVVVLLVAFVPWISTALL